MQRSRRRNVVTECADPLRPDFKSSVNIQSNRIEATSRVTLFADAFHDINSKSVLESNSTRIYNRSLD